METKVFFQFEIIINVLVRSFRLIKILMLWVYISTAIIIFLILPVLGSNLNVVCGRQILMSKDGPCTDRVRHGSKYSQPHVVDPILLIPNNTRSF